MIFGLPAMTFIWVFALPIIGCIVTLIVMIKKHYEGKSVEEEYGEEEWYHTF